MKFFTKFAAVAALTLPLGACVVAVNPEGWDGDRDRTYVHDDDAVKIPLDENRRIEFACPSGYEVFTKSDAEGASEYGCRRVGTGAL